MGHEDFISDPDDLSAVALNWNSRETAIMKLNIFHRIFHTLKLKLSFEGLFQSIKFKRLKAELRKLWWAVSSPYLLNRLAGREGQVSR